MVTDNHYTPKLTLQRFYEDRVKELGLTARSVARKFKEKHDVSKYMVTTLLRNPRTARINHVIAMADVLQLDDWYIDLVEPFGFGASGCTVDEFNELLAGEGYTLGRVVNVAA